MEEGAFKLGLDRHGDPVGDADDHEYDESRDGGCEKALLGPAQLGSTEEVDALSAALSSV